MELVVVSSLVVLEVRVAVAQVGGLFGGTAAEDVFAEDALEEGGDGGDAGGYYDGVSFDAVVIFVSFVTRNRGERENDRCKHTWSRGIRQRMYLYS